MMLPITSYFPTATRSETAKPAMTRKTQMPVNLACGTKPPDSTETQLKVKSRAPITPLFSGSLGRAKRRQGCPVEGHQARNELQLLVMLPDLRFGLSCKLLK